MRRLIPPHPDPSTPRDLDELYLDLTFPDLPPDRPHVYLGMVASVDGGATVDDRSGALGGDADRVAFRRLREWSDAVLVGAGTVRAEDYGPPRLSDDARARRRARGQAELPRLVIVTRSANLDPEARVFDDRDRRPLLLTVEDADEEALGPLRDVADVLAAGHGSVDLAEGLRRLRDDGVEHLLCEGGPSLNAQLASERLVDDLFLTVAPQVVGDPSRRIVEGDVVDAPLELTLTELHEHEGELLLRYRFGG